MQEVRTAEDSGSPSVSVDGKTVFIRDENSSWSIDRRTFDMQRVPEASRTSLQITVEVPEGAQDWSIIKSFDRERPMNESEEKLPSEKQDVPNPHITRGNLALTTLGALGVVFGDIGTSPLYTVQTLFGSVEPGRDEVIGGISTVIWLISLVVMLKYISIVLRVHNRGEGGIMALTALAASGCNAGSFKTMKLFVLFVGVLGTAMFYADSVLTPAVSVLSALEGIAVATPALDSRTMPIALVVLCALFLVQRFGTGFVGRLFGPLLFLWFLMLAVVGIEQLVQEPAILQAFNPARAVNFLVNQNSQSNLFPVVGSVVLGVTGSECLYADLGHFGPLPIRLAWFLVVMPALFLNYLGQGALLLRDPSLADNPFYHAFPDNFLYPAVVMSTLATIIASQSVVSGTFSMTCQAISLGYLPRLTIRHTSNTKIGRIYVPTANFILGVAVLVVTGAFGKSANLANAYGLSVTMTMTVTTLLTALVGVLSLVTTSRCALLPLLVTPLAAILTLDLLLLISCTNKFLDGAWLPFLFAILLFAIMSTWAKGSRLLRDAVRSELPPLQPFLAWLTAEPLHRAQRAAVYPVSDLDSVPPALVLNLRQHRAIHEAVVILKVSVAETPTVPDASRLAVTEPAKGYWRVEATYGFKEEPDVPAIISRLVAEHALPVDVKAVGYFIFRPLVAARPASRLLSVHGLSVVRKWLFAAMHHNASTAMHFLRIPHSETMEVGAEVII